MIITYLPLTRLVRSYRDSIPIDLIEEHFHCTIDSGLIRMVKKKDRFLVQLRGYCCGQFYPTWHLYDSATTLSSAIALYLDAVNEHLYSVSNARCSHV